MSFFQKKLKGHAAPSAIQTVVQSLRQILDTHQYASSAVTQAALALESVRNDEIDMLNTAAEGLSLAVEQIAAQLGIGAELSMAQKEAATAAGLLAGDVRQFLNHKIDMPTVATENMSIVNMTGLGMEDVVGLRPAFEAYDERENRNAAIYSIAYNMQAARQDEFGETFFPTIVVTPDNVGFGVTVRLMMVYNGIHRQISGALDNYNKKNIIRAIADYTLLKNEMTRLIPVYRPESADKFVDSALIPSYNLNLEGEVIPTAPLAVGKSLSLLGISQTDTLLASGLMDITDSIDPAIRLAAVYVGVESGGNTDILKFNTLELPLATFAYAQQNNYRVMYLNFSTSSVLVNKDTRNLDGSDFAVLNGIKSGDLMVRLKLDLSGQLNIELGDTVVYGNRVAVHSVSDAAGNALDLASGVGKTISDLFESHGKILGYELQAYRTNINRRQRGQLIDTTYYTQLYNVPMRSPITAIHPMTMDGQTDAGDLASLITATRIRTSNMAVGALVNTANILRAYVDARDGNNTPPDVLGVGRFFVLPRFSEETLDMSVIVDSLTSTNRVEDLQNAIINKIRDHAYRLYRDSEYKAAADALNGGISPVPTVIVGTDPVLARYLTVTGDLRTLGGQFDVRIVSTLDYRVAGKIFITFGVFDENRNVEPNPLNFGNMAWSPELTIVLPISREGQVSKELAVSPRFTHVSHLPIMAVLTVENLPDVLNKVPLDVNTHAVP